MTVTFREAVTLALEAELESDPTVVFYGEDVADAGGVFKTTERLKERFGSLRVRDTPISEQAIVGSALGAALTGLRPIVEIMFADFFGVCFDQIANELAKYRYMSGGQGSVPVTVRTANGGGVGFAAQHSQSVENWLLNVPGLKLVAPSTVHDMFHLLRAAVRDDNPVVVFEHKALYPLRGEIEEGPVEIGRAAVRRVGSEVTAVATQVTLHRTLSAAERLAEHIDIEVIDLRSIEPMDLETVIASVTKTGRCVCVQESPFKGSWGATLAALVTSSCFEHLDAAPQVIAAPSTPIPYSGALEDEWVPTIDRIEKEIRKFAYE